MTSECDTHGLVVGVLSDTHGRLHARVARSLEGVDHIIHAGDVGSPEVLSVLTAIAPVTVVRGNCDLDDWARDLPLEERVELAGIRIAVRHIGRRVDARDAEVAVSGHTHSAKVETRDGVLYVNPGSAGPPRSHRPRTLVRLTLCPRLEAEVLEIAEEP